MWVFMWRGVFRVRKLVSYWLVFRGLKVIFGYDRLFVWSGSDSSFFVFACLVGSELFFFL